MDSEIYKLLARADQEKNVEFIRQAFHILDPDTPSQKDKSTKDIENFGQNLYIECAEKAIGFEDTAIAKRCLQIYFGLPRISNQFLARAYLCQFELNAPKATNQLENLDKSLPFLFKAIEFAKHNKRYNFLVYNSSIIFWKYARAFMKKNFRNYLCLSLKVLTDALKEIDDADYEWRAFLQRTLIEAYIDNKQFEEANDLAWELLRFIRNYLPNTFDDYFEFLIDNNLLNDEDVKSMSANKWELSAIYRIEKLKKSSKAQKKLTNNKKLEDENSISEEAIKNELNEIYKLLVPKNKYHANLENVEESSQFMKANVHTTIKKEDFAAKAKRQRLLLNLAHVSLIFEEVNLCSQILAFLKETELINEEFSLELDFLDCELIVKSLAHKQERYQKSIVRLRVETINRFDEVLHNAKRLLNPRLIQLGCLMQWNTILPLLQAGIRSQIRKPLQIVAEYLEEIDSMEWLLRCQIHFELAKCDEEIEQLQTAEQHLLKAIQLDDELVYREQLQHALKRLRLRAELYKTPEVIEDQAAMILEQCVIGGKTSNEKNLKPAIADLLASLNNKPGGEHAAASSGQINIHSLLLRAADLLAPSEFTHVLESETFKAFGKSSDNQIARLYKKSANYEICIKKCSEHLNDRIADLERQHRRSDPNIKSEELEPLIRTDFKLRFKLWFDLCKIARKHQIWDICRVSCRFALIYDIDKHVTRFLKSGHHSRKHETSAHSHRKSANPSDAKFASLFDREIMRNIAEVHFIFGEALVHYIRQEGVELLEKPTMPDLAEQSAKLTGAMQKAVKFSDIEQKPTITAESGTELTPENKKEWHDYCDWLNRLSKETIDHFLRGIAIGVQLNETHIVTQGGAYIWNYLHHIFEKMKFNQVAPILNELLDALKKIGHNNEPDLLVAVCVALANGLIAPWLPHEQVKALQIPAMVSEAAANEKTDSKALQKKAPQASQAVNPTVKPFSLSAEASSDFKKALEICDYALNITNGDNLADLVSLKARHPLIKTWVLLKQFNQSSIKNLGVAKLNTKIERTQDKYTKCMVGTEILCRNLKLSSLGLTSYETKDAPSIKELAGLIELAQNWPDKLIELELWSSLAFVAGRLGQTENLHYCHSKSLECLSYFEKRKQENKGLYKTSQLLLCQACMALGEHLAALCLMNSNPINHTPSGSSSKHKEHQLSSTSHHSISSFKDIRLALRREALNAFADAASYAAKAENYELSIHSARHYWNLCLPYLQQMQERAYLYDNLREILHSLHLAYKFKPVEADKAASLESEEAEKAATTAEEAKKKETDVKSNKPNKSKTTVTDVTKDNKKKDEQAQVDANKKRGDSKSPTKQTLVDLTNSESKPHDSAAKIEEKPYDPFEDAFDDLTLRCVLYACLFQIHIDKQQFEEALEEMEMALNELPRTKHRLLIYRFKVVTKSKLGLDVQMDLQKFREESEKNLAQMYRKVAVSSLRRADTISLYQKAIETLQSEENIWNRFEYIIELSQWMYSNEYKLVNCLDLCEWAINLVMFSVKTEKTIRSGSQMYDAGRRRSSATDRMQNKKQLSAKPPQAVRHSLLPTIEDGVELKKVHQDIEKNAQNDFEQVNKAQADKKLMFNVLNENKNLSLNDLTNVKQLEALCRAFTIIAHMTGRQSKDYVNYILSAHVCVTQLFIQAYESAVAALKDIQKSDAAQSDLQVAEGGKSNKKDGKTTAVTDKKGDQQKKPTKVEPTLPKTAEAWSQFELNADVAHAWSHELMKKTGINSNTISEPCMFFYYLDLLGNMLIQKGFSHFLFPIYYLQLVLANYVINLPIFAGNSPAPHATTAPATAAATSHARNVSLSIYTRMKLLNLCVELNLSAAVTFHQQQLASFILSTSKPAELVTEQSGSILSTVIANPSIFLKLVQIDAGEVCAVREQIYSHKKRMAQVQEEEASQSLKSYGSIGSLSNKNESSSSFKLKRKQQQLLLNKTTQNVKINEGAGKGKKLSDENTTTLVESIKLPGQKPSMYENLSDMLYKDIWLKIAEQLIQCGFFHAARDYLYECLNACISFESRHSLAKVYFYLGQIALYDNNFIEAKNYASSAQRVAIDELFWFKSIELLVNAHKLDCHNDSEAYEKCEKILQKSLEIVTSEKSNRSNKYEKLVYIEAMLEYHLAELTCDGLLNDKLNDGEFFIKKKPSKRLNQTKNSLHYIVFKKLSGICNTYANCASSLIKTGYIRESIDVIRSHARLLNRFANDCENLDSKKDFLLQTYSVYCEAIVIMDNYWIDICSLQNSDSFNISLTVQRELVDLKLEVCTFFTDMLETHLFEVKDINERNLNKNNMIKTVENFIASDENLTEIEKQWRRNIATLPDLTSATLASCHSLSNRLKHFRTCVYYLIGRNFRLVGELKHQLRKTNLNESEPASLTFKMFISKWSNAILDIYKQLAQTEAESKSRKATSVKQPAGNQSVDLSGQNQLDSSFISGDVSQHATLANFSYITNNFVHDEVTSANMIIQENIKNLLASVNQADSQAMECLLQALTLGFTIEDKELMRNITLELIELVGQLDLVVCSQLIAFYQSCSNSHEIENIIRRSSLDPKNSLLSGYLHQLSFYTKANVKYNLLNSPIVKQTLDLTKSKFNAFKFLSMSPNHFNVSKDLPPTYIVLMLQHNHKKTEMYVSFIDCSKNQSSGGKQVKASSQSVNRTTVTKIKTKPAELSNLQQKWREWRNDLKNFHLKLEFQINNSLSKKEATLQSSVVHGEQNTLSATPQSLQIGEKEIEDLAKYYLNSNNSKNSETIDALNSLNTRFEQLIQQTECYMAKMTEFVQSYFDLIQEEQQQAQQQANSKAAAGTALPSFKPNERLIILADLDLFEFPLESLKVFHDSSCVSSISRDFSLHFLSTRFAMQKESMNTNSGKDDKSKQDKENKSNDKKTAPVATTQLAEPLPDNAIVIEHAKLKYFVDVFNEYSIALPSEFNLSTQFKKLQQHYSLISSKWTGVCGGHDKHAISLGECERMLLDSNCFLFNSLERFLSYFSSNRISSLNLNECRLIFANDLAETSKSYSRLGKIDVLRNPIEVECENPLESAVLLSLTGVKSIMLNQWSSTLVENCEKFQEILKEFLENRQSVGEIVRYRAAPHLKYLIKEKSKKEEERRQQAEKEKEKKDTKKDTKKDVGSKIDKSPSKKGEKKRTESALTVDAKATIDTNWNEMDNEEKARLESAEEEKSQEYPKNISKLRKENLNLICYGLPDVYMMN